MGTSVAGFERFAKVSECELKQDSSLVRDGSWLLNYLSEKASVRSSATKLSLLAH